MEPHVILKFKSKPQKDNKLMNINKCYENSKMHIKCTCVNRWLVILSVGRSHNSNIIRKYKCSIHLGIFKIFIMLMTYAFGHVSIYIWYQS